ncbi:Nramp family divalent metal transporter [Gemmatimonas sp.]|jgi:manganese transport protein|uniref:Nramp family divalent metal transporter n=2 Tax=Gemmatimonas sp. TaxID=1962908 RepID=UPI0022C9E524|nr:Nramp family divalent metal transporter [Gemmatimonas sp.]MCA2984724.1 Nramp family divalent metal transporter [Gemmatimonas sp.]MCA2988771.1 Nramp family divalent metal transporter [Gemmatimonas sp.]MCA2991380.1 Nramp family divalent metal transporter [Gemmatimonas sp.]MCA2993470.1 Nramp family divalent metal transporter [Gemmatimonas sp.]MCZ8013444.1 Nramp family divalent metal transporter [Gemmatimonas sp.]
MAIPNPVPPADATTGAPDVEPGWRRARLAPSLSEVHRSVEVHGATWFRKLLAFAGPGYLVAVGYMDPGNWATDLAGGSRFGYALLSVILLSNLMAVLLQGLASKLGIVTGRDLAQACRDHYSRRTGLALWVLCELAIAACDLAEVIGTAIALNLLFGISLPVGIAITAFDVMIVLYLQNKGFRLLEALVIALIAVVGGCFVFELFISKPDIGEVARGFVPTTDIITNPEMLYIAIGILGATVMPHNLYLHSSIVQTRKYAENTEGKREAVRFAFLDSTIALTFALFINAAILIVAAATFHTSGNTEVAEIQDAYKLLSPLLGVGGASAVFALALLASGQNSTLTGTLAGQIVMEGFLDLRLRPWLRRLITRAIAIVPAAIVAILYGESGTAKLLVLSQVILSLQLSFAVFPLVQFTSDKVKMGAFVNSTPLKIAAYTVATVIASLNVWLLAQTVRGWMR